MNPDHDSHPDNQENSAPVERLLTGLVQQRDELGGIADELLDLFRRHGLTPPQDPENQT